MKCRNSKKQIINVCVLFCIILEVINTEKILFFPFIL